MEERTIEIINLILTSSIIIFILSMGFLIAYTFLFSSLEVLRLNQMVSEVCNGENYEFKDMGAFGYYCYEYKDGYRIRHYYAIKDNKLYEVKE